MSKVEPDSRKKERNKSIRWVLTIFLVTILVSGVISYVSEEIMSTSGIIIAFGILFAIVCLGIVFDIIGVAVTSADERPFHSMAARKVPGAIEAIRLLRNAERVSSICNDVVETFAVSYPVLPRQPLPRRSYQILNFPGLG